VLAPRLFTSVYRFLTGFGSRPQYVDALVETGLGVTAPPAAPALDLRSLVDCVVGEELLRRAFQDAAVASFILDAAGRLSRVNRALCELAGAGEEDMLGADIADVAGPDAAAWGRQPPLTPRPGEVRLDRRETRWLRRDGTVLDVELTLSAVGGVDGTPAFTIAQVHDIGDRRVAARRLAHQALHDPLTTLPNRTLFVERLERGLRRQQRSDSVLAVLFVDLDRFKQINDSLGHAAGDQVLGEVAARLREVLRPGDTIARLGGDEFAVLCEGLADEAAALDVGERVLRAVAAPMTVQEHHASVCASVGIAVTRDGLPDGETMVANADFAMYQAKERGRSRCVVFDASMRAQALARIEQTAALRQALERDELRLVYQPLVRVDGGGVVGVEALVRWQHPERGLLCADAFVRLAEETGLMPPLGTWVLREACREFSTWAPPPGEDPPQLSVNVSAQQLGGGTLVDTLRCILADTGLHPSRLCLEITESVLLDDAQPAAEALAELRRLGVRLAIDDFGTSYSSLSYLRRFAVDVIKVDRSFVGGLGADPAADAIVSAIVNVSRALGFGVVAEGVETEEQLVALRALGCDFAQGHLWSPPLEAASAHRWLRSRRPTAVAAISLDLGPLLAQRVEALRASTGRNALLQVPATLPAAFADLTAVKIVVDHLLGNAAMYSPADRPVVVTAAADRRAVRVDVADFGIGMSAEETARCFEQFWQARGPEGPRSGGVGMGLYIVRSLVEAMGGHVMVRSAVGKGSTFTVTLPRTARAAARVHSSGGSALDVAEPSSIQEFMRQIGVPMRRRR